MTCPWPDCDGELEGIRRYCHKCSRYSDDFKGASPQPVTLPLPSGPVTGITLPLPPSANDTTRSIARMKGMRDLKDAVALRNWAAVDQAMAGVEPFVSVTTSKGGKIWQGDAERWLETQGIEMIPKGVPVSVRSMLYFPNNRRDLDNAIKPLLDVLQGFVFGNDRQVEHLEFWKLFDKERPRTELAASAMIPPPPAVDEFQFDLKF